jgi:3-oxoacyl-[acyl-carrier-protein] synthase II
LSKKEIYLYGFIMINKEWTIFSLICNYKTDKMWPLSENFSKAKLTTNKISCISGHGTGTLYNDGMEITAFKHLFKNKPIPLYSIKGAIGHTLGAAGLIETIVALKVLKEKTAPGTIGLKDPEEPAAGWVSTAARKIKPGSVMLNNCGFGGVNSVLILTNIN